MAEVATHHVRHKKSGTLMKINQTDFKADIFDKLTEEEFNDEQAAGTKTEAPASPKPVKAEAPPKASAEDDASPAAGETAAEAKARKKLKG